MKSIFKESRTYLKLGFLGVFLACLLSASATLRVDAMPASAPEREIERVQVYVGDIPYAGDAVLYRDTTYVELGQLTEAMHPLSRAVDETTRSASFIGADIEIYLQDSATYLVANGRYLWCENGVFVRGKRAYVPLRAAVKAFGGALRWDSEEFAAYVTLGDTPIQSGEEFYNEDELHWLSRIIYAEAGAEPFLGQMAVGNVVLNRVRHAQFPDSIHGVIFDTKHGVQFTPVANGMIYCTPDEDAIVAAKLCLEGYTLSEEILYFLNPRLAVNFWVPQNRPFVMTISGHDFYS